MHRLRCSCPEGGQKRLAPGIVSARTFPSTSTVLLGPGLRGSSPSCANRLRNQPGTVFFSVSRFANPTSQEEASAECSRGTGGWIDWWKKVFAVRHSRDTEPGCVLRQAQDEGGWCFTSHPLSACRHPSQRQSTPLCRLLFAAPTHKGRRELIGALPSLFERQVAGAVDVHDVVFPALELG